MRSTIIARVMGGLSLCFFFQYAHGMVSGTGSGQGCSLLVPPACVHSCRAGLLQPSWGPLGTLGTVFLGSTPTTAAPGTPDTSKTREDSWIKRGGRVAGSVLGRAALYLVLLAGLVMIPLGLGGTFVMVGAAAVFGALTGFDQITLRFLAVLLGLALLGEGIESLLGVAMARRYGASKWGMWGAFLGGIFGAVVGTPVPVVGNLVGALIGVFAGAFLFELLGRGPADSSLKAGWGALLGRAAASAIKLALGMAILILTVAKTLG